jgi:hypothetical protein
VKRSTRIIVFACAVALLASSLWVRTKLRAMRREVADWKAAQIAFAASRPTAAEILSRAEDAGFHGWLVKEEDDGTVSAVHVAGPQWHYAWFQLESGRAVSVSFSVK